MNLTQNQKKHIKDLYYSPLNFIEYILLVFFKGVSLGKNYKFYGIPHIHTARSRGKINIGNNFIATSKISRNSIGVFQKVIIKCFPGAILKIGNNVGISGSSISCSKKIQIGNNVLIGSGCLITDSDAHPVNPIKRENGQVKKEEIIIEDNVFIGARSIILKGVKIGKGSVIGAGSVVAKNIPAYCIAAGNPVKILGDSRQA